MNCTFTERTDRQYNWEAYYSPQGQYLNELFVWCYETFGKPGDRWDCHGGWIKLRSDKEYTMFILRWS